MTMKPVDILTHLASLTEPGDVERHGHVGMMMRQMVEQAAEVLGVVLTNQEKFFLIQTLMDYERNDPISTLSADQQDTLESVAEGFCKATELRSASKVAAAELYVGVGRKALLSAGVMYKRVDPCKKMAVQVKQSGTLGEF